MAIYKVATRSGDEIVEPELVHTIEVGAGPDNVSPNGDCTILAVANEGEGDYGDELVNPEGSVTLLKATSGTFLDATSPPEAISVTFPWTDDELLAKGVHLPLSEKALEYWDEHSAIADGVDFASARASYTAGMYCFLNVCVIFIRAGESLLLALSRAEAFFISILTHIFTTLSVA